MPTLSVPMVWRLLQVSVLGAFVLAGCAKHETTKPVASPASHTVSPAPTDAAASHRTTHTPVPLAEETTRPAEAVAEDAERTGIVACDDYLSSYLACHRAAEIYAPDQLQARYEAMRTSLLRDAKNPDIRPQLSGRCNSLATQLRQALHGKSCVASPEPDSP